MPLQRRIFFVVYLHVSDHFQYVQHIFTTGPCWSDIYATFITRAPYMSLQRVTYAIYAVTYARYAVTDAGSIWPYHLMYIFFLDYYINVMYLTDWYLVNGVQRLILRCSSLDITNSYWNDRNTWFCGFAENLLHCLGIIWETPFVEL